MKPAPFIAVLVILGMAVTTAVSLAQFHLPWNEMLPSPNIEAVGELPAADDASETKDVSAARPSASEGGEKPEAVVDETEFNFGYLANNTDDHEHDFIVKNSGTAPLRILRSEVSCNKCTFATLPSEAIPPGGSGAVRVRWNINTPESIFRQSVTVHTNDSDHALVRFVITGKIVRPLEIKPSALVFSNLATEEGGQGGVRLFAYFTAGLQVVEHHFTHEETADYFAAEFTPIPPRELDAGIESGLELKVTVKPGLPLGAFKQRIRFKTNLEDEGEQEVAITGKVSGPVMVIATGWNQEHGVLVLGHVNRSEGVKRNVSLLIRGKEFRGLKLEPAKSDPDALHVTYGKMSEINNGSTIMAPLTIEIPKGAPSISRMGNDQGKFGEITIASDHPDLPPIKLMVQFAVIDK
ncbi:MAG TPA: DUF1573 domain-containing protein [Pirellulales bacterium]|nr:DUF1573 domain-containing protein [Pirellulales bacterium]